MAAHERPTSRDVAAIVLVGMGLSVAGCAGGIRGAAAPTTPDPAEPAQTAARSVWGLVPDAPRGGADVTPELIRGSAVAVSENTLLASCRAVGDRRAVGLVRRDAYRTATVAARDLDGQVCALRVDQGSLLPVPAFRGLGDLRVGEPVVAFANRTRADLALVRGWLAATSGEPEPFIETTLVLPPDTLSGVVFDAQGNLIGLGSAGPTPDAYTLAAPVADPLAPRLAAVEIGASETVQASLESDPGDAEPPPPLWLTLASGRDGDNGRLTTLPTGSAGAAQGTRAPAAPASAAAFGNTTPAAGATAPAAGSWDYGTDARGPAENAAAQDGPSQADRSTAADGTVDASSTARGRSTRSIDDAVGGGAQQARADGRGRGRQGERGGWEKAG